MKYRKKPVVIEAFKYEGFLKSEFGTSTLPEWALEAFANGILHYEHVAYSEIPELFVYTLEGKHLVRNGDYIIKGACGELYNCREDIFESTYEEVLVQN